MRGRIGAGGRPGTRRHGRGVSLSVSAVRCGGRRSGQTVRCPPPACLPPLAKPRPGHHCRRRRLLALAVGVGPSGAPLDFRNASRGAAATLDELGRLVLNACQVVPGGVVLFFPSFSYADQVHARWDWWDWRGEAEGWRDGQA